MHACMLWLQLCGMVASTNDCFHMEDFNVFSHGPQDFPDDALPKDLHVTETDFILHITFITIVRTFSVAFLARADLGSAPSSRPCVPLHFVHTASSAYYLLSHFWEPGWRPQLFLF